MKYTMFVYSDGSSLLRKVEKRSDGRDYIFDTEGPSYTVFKVFKERDLVRTLDLTELQFIELRDLAWEN